MDAYKCILDIRHVLYFVRMPGWVEEQAEKWNKLMVHSFFLEAYLIYR